MDFKDLTNEQLEAGRRIGNTAKALFDTQKEVNEGMRYVIENRLVNSEGRQVN